MRALLDAVEPEGTLQSTPAGRMSLRCYPPQSVFASGIFVGSMADEPESTATGLVQASMRRIHVYC
jgi:hypothetical protein